MSVEVTPYEAPPPKGLVRQAFANRSFVTGFVITALIAAMALLSFLWTPFDITHLVVADRMKPPSWQHPFGTDHFGRDILSMVMIGARNSIAVAVVAVGIGMAVGVPLGCWAAARGGWVDEATPPAPGSARGQGRLDAERTWRALGAGASIPVAVLRIAGIYGPGRSALDQLRRGTAHRIDKPGQVFSRIHVEDLGRIAAAAAVQRAGGVFNLCDGEPAPPQDVVAHAAELSGLPCPPLVPFDQAELSPMARSFYSENKRTRSVRVASELGIELLYPDYRAGLRAILARGG